MFGTLCLMQRQVLVVCLFLEYVVCLFLKYVVCLFLKYVIEILTPSISDLHSTSLPATVRSFV